MNATTRDTSKDTSEALRVLVLSRSYPNNVMELLGLWVQSLVRESTRFCQVKVVSPVPYCPPLPGLPHNYARFRSIKKQRWDGEIEVLHPRMVLGPGYSTHQIEWFLYDAAIRKSVDRLRKQFPFDLIHAHFTYPDGVAAVRLGQRYGVPVVITEQNPWGPWMNQYPIVRRKAIWAARHSAFHVGISTSVQRTIEHFAGKLGNLVVVPDGVEASVFTLPAEGHSRVPGQILFVGAVRPVKGVDILLRTIRLLVDRGFNVSLIILGEAYYGPYQQEERRLKAMVGELNLSEHVKFIGKQPLSELIRYMQESALLVLPSRAESLGMVLVEALACGTPVVATRCGGPEDIVNEQVGVLVPPEDPEALARGIQHVLEHPADYRSAKLRAHAVDNFGLESVGDRMSRLYHEAVRDFRAKRGTAASLAQGGSVAN